jgi:hypothetical protein
MGREVGYAGGVRIAKVGRRVRRPVQTQTVETIPVPVAGNRDITRVAIEEGGFSDAGLVAIGHVDETVRRPAKGQRIDLIPIPVSDDGNIPGISEGIDSARSSESAPVVAKPVDDVNARIPGPVDGEAVAPVPVEVAGERNITRVAEHERLGGSPSGILIAEKSPTRGPAI